VQTNDLCVRVVSERAEWDAYVANSGLGGVGHHWGMGRVLGEFYGYDRYLPMGVCESPTGPLVAVFPCVVRRSESLYSMGEGVRGGVLSCTARSGEQVGDALRRYISREGYSLVQVTSASTLPGHGDHGLLGEAGVRTPVS